MSSVSPPVRSTWVLTDSSEQDETDFSAINGNGPRHQTSRKSEEFPKGSGLLKNQFADFKRNGQTLNKSAQSALSILMLQERENKVPDRAHFSRAGEA
ncbi:hypothetical protein F2P81_008933 [Scophthalmus maximus]|uniref:Uncharacterized protein n=1 Tax=Scophthalmus maximus TaxID=52904 RepID=A0A6A4T0A9_SCOMX|nr:hypothetical protein F2P81_008933 [Scophthalmus maximus]